MNVEAASVRARAYTNAWNATTAIAPRIRLHSVHLRKWCQNGIEEKAAFFLWPLSRMDHINHHRQQKTNTEKLKNIVVRSAHAGIGVAFGVRSFRSYGIDRKQSSESHHYRILFPLVPEHERKIYLIVLVRCSDTADACVHRTVKTEGTRTHKTKVKLMVTAKWIVFQRCISSGVWFNF